MKAFVWASLLSLVAPTWRAHGQVSSPAQRAQLVEAVRQRDLLAAAEGERVARAAPYVFIGRPLTGGNRLDGAGRWHHMTVVQVLEVLRGGARLGTGTVALTDPLGDAGPRPLGRPPTAAELRPPGGRESYGEGAWGVYFCRPAAGPGPLAPYRTDNALRLRSYAQGVHIAAGQAFILSTDEGCRQALDLAGPGQHFAAETDLWDYLLRVADVTPRRKAVATYPLPVLVAGEAPGLDYRTQPVRGRGSVPAAPK